jgi:hypothetical protein
MALSIYNVEEESWDRSHGVASLTDRLLSSTFGDKNIEGLRDGEWAIRSENFFEYRVKRMGEGNILCPGGTLTVLDGQYELPEFDINEATAIGVAMAMLILSTVENELMLDTQIEGIKASQGQKESASITKMQKLRKQIRKARYKTRFQKFMAWLMDTWLMKFLKSTYGKIIMTLISVVVTIASMGTAAPAMLALNALIWANDIVEMATGKSMQALIIEAVPEGAGRTVMQLLVGGAEGLVEAIAEVIPMDDTVKMALKMALQIAQMVVQMVASRGSGTGQAVSSMMQMVAKAAMEVQKILQRVTVALQLLEGLNSFAKSGEQANMLWHTAQAEAIRTEYDGKDAYYQTIIDHQMEDIEALINYVKASFARAAEVIREQGEVNRMIAQNLVI